MGLAVFLTLANAALVFWLIDKCAKVQEFAESVNRKLESHIHDANNHQAMVELCEATRQLHDQVTNQSHDLQESYATVRHDCDHIRDVLKRNHGIQL